MVVSPHPFVPPGALFSRAGCINHVVCALVAAALVAGAVPVRAQSPGKAATPKAATPGVQPTLQKIRQTGVVTLAHRESSVPFSYFDADKRPVGYALELCLKVVDAIRRDLKLQNLRVEYLPVTPAARIPSIVEGKADLECGNTTNTADRRKSVAFAVTHFFAGGRLLVKTKSKVQRLADVRRGTIVTTKGSTHARFITERQEKGLISARLIEAKDTAEAFGILQRDEADAFLFDDIVLYSLRAQQPDPDAYAVVGELTTVEPLAIMLRRNDPDFKRIVDVTLSRLMIDGELRPMYSKWFLAPIPPKGVTLNVPMSPLMRDQTRFPTDKVGDE